MSLPSPVALINLCRFSASLHSFSLEQEAKGGIGFPADAAPAAPAPNVAAVAADAAAVAAAVAAAEGA